MTPTALAALIIKRIIEDAGSTYDKLEARAVAKGISMDVFQAAMTIVHRSKLIEQSVKFGVIQYKVKEKKIAKPFSAVEWVTVNYPKMDNTNDGSGIDVDFSYLFLTPEEMERYKAEAKGRTFIPRKKKAYEYARG
jgi:hypothetical protein